MGLRHLYTVMRNIFCVFMSLNSSENILTLLNQTKVSRRLTSLKKLLFLGFR